MCCEIQRLWYVLFASILWYYRTHVSFSLTFRISVILDYQKKTLKWSCAEMLREMIDPSLFTVSDRSTWFGALARAPRTIRSSQCIVKFKITFASLDFAFRGPLRGPVIRIGHVSVRGKCRVISNINARAKQVPQILLRTATLSRPSQNNGKGRKCSENVQNGREPERFER